MGIDTSAIIAILRQEPEAQAYALAIQKDPVRLLSAASALEAALMIEARKGASGERDLDLLLHHAKAEVVPFTAEQFAAARHAWRNYGKGSHPARLNFGDCCAYALAYVGEKLLAKGVTFVRLASGW